MYSTVQARYTKSSGRTIIMTLLRGCAGLKSDQRPNQCGWRCLTDGQCDCVDWPNWLLRSAARETVFRGQRETKRQKPEGKGANGQQRARGGTWLMRCCGFVSSAREGG